MSFRLETPNTLAEYSAIAELYNLARIAPVSAQELYHAEIESPHDSYFQRIIAVNEKGTIVGTSVVRPHWEQCFVSVTTHPDYQHQEIGNTLYAQALNYLRKQTTAPLITILRDNAPQARAFAEARGFTLHQHWRYFQLDLSSFDREAHSAIIPSLNRQGITFLSLADAQNTPENQRKLYELNRRTSLDAPGEDSFPSFEEFATDVYNADWFHPDGQIIAADGDQWVGLGAVGIDSDSPGTAFNAFTGVDRSHRRRYIATALTMLTIEYARQHAASTLRVFNDSRNDAMIHMQRQLGYQPIPGRYIMTQA